jgi:hypothetical protein
MTFSIGTFFSLRVTARVSKITGAVFRMRL